MKFRIFLLTVLLMIFSIATESFAKENYFRENALNFEVIYDDNEEPPVMLFSSRLQPIEEYLAEQFANHTEKVYVSQYDITLSEIMVILSEHYEYMVVSGDFVFEPKSDSADDSNPTVEYIVPKYIFSSPDEDEEGRKFIEDSVKEYADYARSKTNDPVEQLLLVHDKILKNTKYDFNYNTVSFSAYGLFKNNTCVCQGYAEAIYLISKELGIDAGFCSYFFKNSDGDYEGHIWNYINIDNQWYQLDATWNEPTEKYTDEKGVEHNIEYDNAGHSYFLVSDTVIEENHYSKDVWVTSLDEKPECDSKKYEKNHLFNIIAPFTTEYNDGYFNATVNINGRSDIFSTKTLNTDAVIASKGYIMSDVYYIFYAFTESIADASFIFAADENSRLSDTKVMVKDAAIGNGIIADFNVSLSSIPYSKTGNNCLYVWSLKTLEPYGKKVYIK